MPRALKYMGGEHTRMCGRNHRCASSQIAPWHTRTPPLALTDYENVVAQRIASDKRSVLGLRTMKNEVTQRECHGCYIVPRSESSLGTRATCP